MPTSIPSPCIIPILLLTTILLLPACKKDNDTGGDNNPPSQAEYYFTGKLDGQALRFELDGSGQDELTIGNDASLDPPLCTFGYGCTIGSVEPDQPYVGVSFPGLFSGDCGMEGAAFSGLFTLGLYGYGQDVRLDYWDGQEMWTTDGGQQTSAVFEITKSERVEIFGVSQKVGGKASCTVYNSAGASKQLTDAQFVLSFSPYF